MKRFFKIVGLSILSLIGLAIAFIWYDYDAEGFRRLALWIIVPVVAVYIINDLIVKPLKIELQFIQNRLDRIERRLADRDYFDR